MKYIAWIIFTLFFLNGCAGPSNSGKSIGNLAETRIDTSKINTLTSLKVVKLSSTHEMAERQVSDKNLSAAFRAIPGAFSGHVIEAPAMYIPVQIGEDFNLSAADLERSFAPSAQPSTSEMVTSGVIVQPADTRYARVGTFAYDPILDKDVLGAGFVDSITKKSITLMYFDRPCTVTGEVHLKDMEISLLLKIPAAGMYWIVTNSVGPLHEEMRNENPKNTLWLAFIE